MVKMRVNNNKESKCEECNTHWLYTPEMYDIHLCENTFTLCKKCTDTLFHKTLKASVLYDGRIKTKVDMKRIKNSKSLLNENNTTGLSIVEALRGIGEN